MDKKRNEKKQGWREKIQNWETYHKTMYMVTNKMRGRRGRNNKLLSITLHMLFNFWKWVHVLCISKHN